MFDRTSRIRNSAIVVLALAALCLLGAPTVFAASSGTIDATSALSREDVAQAMQAEAAAHGLDINTEGMVYATRDDVTLVNASITGIENLDAADLAGGAVVGLVYLSTNGLAPLADGFYALRVTSGPSAEEGTAEFLEAGGGVAYSAPALVSGGRWPWLNDSETTGCIRTFGVVADHHWGPFDVEAYVSWGG